MKMLYSKKFWIFSALALILLIGGFVYFRNGNGVQTAQAVRADIVEEVSATGKVTPNQSVKLGFDRSGRVGGVYVGVGGQVRKGEVLASLEAGESSADLSRAQAALEEEASKLRGLQSTAPLSYSDASKGLDAAIRQGWDSADNAVHNRIDQFFKNVSSHPQFEVSITSGNFTHYFPVPSETELNINSSRKEVENILDDWQSRLSSSNAGDLNAAADSAIRDLRTVSAFLDKVASAVNSFAPAEYEYETTVAGYKAAVSSARSEVSGSISSIVAAKDKLTAAPTLGQGGQFESVLAQEAKVKQAEANVSSLRAALAKSSIIAPFDGTVTVEDAELGEAVSAGSPLISIISQSQMYIEANISEIHIGKVQTGDPVSITFDAFPGQEFQGEVSYVEPGDVVIDGVVNYKVRVSIPNMDPKIKSGLTANLKIKTAQRAGAVALPLYAIEREGSQAFVNKLVEGKLQKMPVELGLSGSNGMVEVLSGVSEGDIVEY